MPKDLLDIDAPDADFSKETLDLTDAAGKGNLSDETLVTAMQALKLDTGLP